MKVIVLEKLLLETWKFFNRFLNTMTTDDKYSLISRDNSKQTNQMHWSQKQKIFLQFFSVFFEFALNLEHFQKKYDPHSLYISKITHHERRA